MIYDVNNNWNTVLNEILKSKEFFNLNYMIEKEYQNYIIYPPKKNVFRALKTTDFYDVKVVILGQDPYFNEGEADGLAFSCSKKEKLPPSLKNIFKELYDDLLVIHEDGDLSKWAQEGVLLLNTVLTVRSGEANSHQGYGWEKFTDEIIKKLSDKRENLVFILWGNNAISKQRLIDCEKHLIIKSPHPSPLSSYRGFFGSRPFSKTNDYLTKNGYKKINW